jgi:hypothetical protein
MIRKREFIQQRAQYTSMKGKAGEDYELFYEVFFTRCPNSLDEKVRDGHHYHEEG